MVEPTHLKHISQIGSFPQLRGEKNKCLKPPPSNPHITVTVEFPSEKQQMTKREARLSSDVEEKLLRCSRGNLVMPEIWSFGTQIFSPPKFIKHRGGKTRFGFHWNTGCLMMGSLYMVYHNPYIPWVSISSVIYHGFLLLLRYPQSWTNGSPTTSIVFFHWFVSSPEFLGDHHFQVNRFSKTLEGKDFFRIRFFNLVKHKNCRHRHFWVLLKHSLVLEALKLRFKISCG